jgi:RHS repeat-associated protein
VNTQRAGQFVQHNLDWVNNRTYRWMLRYSGQGAGTMTVFDGARRLFSKTWNVTGKPLRTGNALRFHVKASSGIPPGNLIAVSVTNINGTAVSGTLQTDGSGNFSQAQAFFSGTTLAQGFIVEGTVTLTFTGRYPPQGSRLNFLVNAGNVDCTQAGAPTTEIAYIQADHLNTPRTVTDSQQQLIWKWDQHDPFGANVPNQDPDGDGKTYTLNLRFPGQYFDAETGLNYNYYRDYDAHTGRYIQADPIGLRGGANVYAYGGGTPSVYVDALGLGKHHPIPKKLYENVGLPPETKKVFADFTTGEAGPVHEGYSAAQKAANEAVITRFYEWTGARGINPTEMTPVQAEEFKKNIVTNPPEATKKYFDEITRWQKKNRIPTTWRTWPKTGIWSIFMPSVWHLCQQDPSHEACACEE